MTSVRGAASRRILYQEVEVGKEDDRCHAETGAELLQQ